MKFIKTLVAGLFALAFVAPVDASTTHIYLVGSTAYRASVHTAIINQLSHGATVSGTAYSYAASSSGGASGLGASPGNAAADSGASQAIYSGVIVGSDNNKYSVIIKTNWSGSAGGIQVVSNSLPISFFTDAAVSGATNTGSTIVPFSGANIETDVPNVAMSDVFQSSTAFTTHLLSDLGPVGVVPFVFVVNADWAGANGSMNITPQLASVLWNNGNLPLALFTGQNTDEGTQVYATGRDNDSGTRLTAFAETGVGVFTQVFQYQPLFGGVVTSASISNVGSGYASAPTLTVYGSGGFGYTSAPTVTVTGGGGTGATFNGVTIANGSVTNVNVNNPGHSYTSAPTVVFTGGLSASGTAAVATAVFQGGQITQIALANPGSGATATASITSGTISGVTVTNSGTGFQSAPSVFVNNVGTGGTGGAITTKTGNYVVTGLQEWPGETVNGLGLVTGNGGYSSGGSLATALGTTGAVSSVGGYLLSYLGTSDANTATGLNINGTFTGSGLGAKVCTYNGNTYTPTNVAEGKYTFWGYEHLYSNTSDAPTLAILGSVVNQISGVDAIIPLTSMNVSRTSDGGLVANDY